MVGAWGRKADSEGRNQERRAKQTPESPPCKNHGTSFYYLYVLVASSEQE